ncbi:MAG TPA: helix-turn-helix transcriptional regulator [Candidatus Polarisedimenticolaceae bacterium]|nr:helix-turn-helix transcriptional regulator [Candidatus Polarisedimenticolaceae bacterium]
MSADAVFAALASPARRRLLDALYDENGQTLGDLCRHMTMSRQAVTQHLDALEEANLVATVWRGREKLHYLNPVPLHEILGRWVSKYERKRLDALADLKARVEGGKAWTGPVSSTSRTSNPPPKRSSKRSATRR